FRESFPALASQHKLALVPFMLEGIAARRELFQDDQIHPTAAAQAAILENIWKGLRPMLGK
ncbi:MAG: arylesterase, partial [Burkholderiales bacterium]|nr:arylesterase [Burkholderiales bacterium]